MKKLITGLLALTLALYSPAWAATRMQMTGFGVVASGGGGGGPAVIPTNQGSHQNGATSTNTVAVTLPATVQSGAACVVTVSYVGGIGGMSATDDKGNTYVEINGAIFNATGGFTANNFLLTNITNGPQTITVTYSTNPFAAIQVDCFSGITTAAPASAFDGEVMVVQNTPANTANAVTSGPITTTINGDLIYGVALDLTGNGSSVGSGFTQLQGVAGAYYSESLIQTTAGPISATFTATVNASSFYIVYAMALKHL